MYEYEYANIQEINYLNPSQLAIHVKMCSRE